MATPLGSTLLDSSSSGDSGALSASSDLLAPLESGIPPARRPRNSAITASGRGEAHVLAGLAASAQTEAHLAALFRAVQHASAGINGAREANRELGRELELVRELLGDSNLREAELEHRVHELEQRLAQTANEALRERSFLIDEQDAFIRSLCDDHEREVAELERRFDRSERHARTEPPAAPAELDAARARIAELEGERGRAEERAERLQAQRDDAQSLLVRIASERDQALTELSRANVPRSSRPSTAPGRPQSSPSVEPRSGLSLKLNSEPLTQRHPTSTPRPPRIELEDMLSAAPPELASALTQPPRSGERSVATPKPGPAMRPVVDYALGAGQVEAERFDTGPFLERPRGR